MIDEVLLTGASGFLGREIQRTLAHNVRFVTIGRGIGNDILADLSTVVPNVPRTIDWVIHAAGHAHIIPRSANEREAFWKVNVEGTRNLLLALEAIPKLRSCVYVSSVSVYGCETGEDIDETHSLDGNSPYARSKIKAEMEVLDWCESRGVVCAVLRLPLVVGAGAPGNLRKMIRAIRQGWYVGIGDGLARKSMVLSTDVANFLPRVHCIGGIYNLTDGVHPTMLAFEMALARALNRKEPWRVPSGMLKAASSLVGWIPGSPINRGLVSKLSSSLTFNDEKARKTGWLSRSVTAHIEDVV